MYVLIKALEVRIQTVVMLMHQLTYENLEVKINTKEVKNQNNSNLSLT